MLIFDIGANIGNYTSAMLEIYPDADVIMVEANPNLIQPLINRYSENPKVKILTMLVSDMSDKLMSFRVNKIEHTLSTASDRWITHSRFAKFHPSLWDQTYMVKTVTLDEMILQIGNPDIIKIDVEGYEKEVLAGLTKKHNGLLSFEWAEEEKENIQWSCSHLRSLGYSKFAFKETDGPYNEVPDTFYSYEEFCKLYFPQLDPARKERWGMIFVQ